MDFEFHDSLSGLGDGIPNQTNPMTQPKVSTWGQVLQAVSAGLVGASTSLANQAQQQVNAGNANKPAVMPSGSSTSSTLKTIAIVALVGGFGYLLYKKLKK